jgi:hypothetical protein
MAYCFILGNYFATFQKFLRSRRRRIKGTRFIIIRIKKGENKRINISILSLNIATPALNIITILIISQMTILIGANLKAHIFLRKRKRPGSKPNAFEKNTVHAGKKIR